MWRVPLSVSSQSPERKASSSTRLTKGTLRRGDSQLGRGRVADGSPERFESAFLETSLRRRLAAVAIAAQQLAVQRLDLYARSAAKFLGQQFAQFVVGAQGLGGIAGGDQGAHQVQVAGLAEGGGADQRPSRTLGSGQLRSAQADPGSGDHLAGPQLEFLELMPYFLDPGGLETRQEGTAGDVEGDVGVGPGVLPVIRLQRRVSDSDRPLGGFDVDPGGVRKSQLDRVSSGQRFRPEGAAEAGELGAQRRRRVDRRLLGPDRGDQLVAADRAAAVEDEVGEQHSTLASAKGRSDVPTLYVSLEASAQLDASRARFGRGHRRKRYGNAVMTEGQHSECKIGSDARQLDTWRSSLTACAPM